MQFFCYFCRFGETHQCSRFLVIRCRKLIHFNGNYWCGIICSVLSLKPKSLQNLQRTCCLTKKCLTILIANIPLSAVGRLEEMTLQIVVNIALLIHLQIRRQPETTAVSWVHACIENVTEKVSWKAAELLSSLLSFSFCFFCPSGA